MLNFLVTDVADGCQSEELQQVISLLKTAVRYLQVLIPVALILWGTIDMGKAVIAGDEKKIKEAQKPFVKRLVSAVIVFLIPFILNLVINIVATGDTTSNWSKCWNAAGNWNAKNVDTIE